VTERVTVREAATRLAASCRPGRVEHVPAQRWLGRVLAEDVRSPADSPPWNRAMLDGFAVRAQDVAAATAACPVTLPVVDAGAAPPREDACAVRIDTGARVPDWCDAVVRIEYCTNVDAQCCQVHRNVPKYEAVQRRGAHVRAGDCLLREGETVGPLEAAVLSDIGQQSVAARAQPRVAIVTLRSEAEARRPDANGPLLQALVQGWGAHVVACETSVHDDPRLAGRLHELVAKADVLVTTGGLSRGSADDAVEVLRGCGVQPLFQGVWMRPGTPVFAGTHAAGAVVLGLSGNPGAAFVNALVLLLPVLYRLGGCEQLGRHVGWARAQAAPHKQLVRHCRYLRGRLTWERGEARVNLAVAQSSAVVSAAGQSLAVIAPGADLAEGDWVPVISVRPIAEGECSDSDLVDRCFGL